MAEYQYDTAACAALAAYALMAIPVQVYATENTEVTVAALQAAKAPSVLIPKEINLKDETICDYSIWAYCEKAEPGSLFDHLILDPPSFVLTNEPGGCVPGVYGTDTVLFD